MEYSISHTQGGGGGVVMNDLAIKANNAANNTNPIMEISTPNQVS
jgi:hypothetical protein